MQQLLNLPDWLPTWVPTLLLVAGLLWALVFLFMPFSVFGVKSRLELIEARLDEIQNEIRHVALRLPPGGGPGVDYDDVYPPRLMESSRAPERIMSRPPIPPARHELYAATEQEIRNAPRSIPAEDPSDATGEANREPLMEDRPPPPLSARPSRRSEPPPRPARSEPRLDWRR
jgi:hypothetical protein